MESINKIEKNIELLIARLHELEGELLRQQQLNATLKEELQASRENVISLQKEKRGVVSVLGILGKEEEKKHFKTRINALIERCDKALELLKTQRDGE